MSVVRGCATLARHGSEARLQQDSRKPSASSTPRNGSARLGLRPESFSVPGPNWAGSRPRRSRSRPNRGRGAAAPFLDFVLGIASRAKEHLVTAVTRGSEPIRRAVQDDPFFSLRRCPQCEYLSELGRANLDPSCPARFGGALFIHKSQSALAKAIGLHLIKIVADFLAYQIANQPSGRHDHSPNPTM
jgi:hypothetical protein